MIKNILIVDDSPVARKMLKKSIPKDMNYIIHEASNGEEAIYKYLDIRHDIIFLDLTMPVLNGYDTIPEIRKINKGAIIVVMTADVQPKSITKVMDLGALTLLKKPAKSESIKDVLEKAESILKKIAGE